MGLIYPSKIRAVSLAVPHDDFLTSGLEVVVLLFFITITSMKEHGWKYIFKKIIIFIIIPFDWLSF